MKSHKPRKQRKAAKNAPLHRRAKRMRVHLSKELKLKYKKRNVRLVTGDKVKIIRGQFKGRVEKVERIDIGRLKVFITGIEREKKDGTKSQVAIDPSNLIAQELKMEDKMRSKVLQR